MIKQDGVIRKGSDAVAYSAGWINTVVAAKPGKRGARRLTALDRHTGRPSPFSKPFDNEVHDWRRNMRWWLAKGYGGFYVMRYW